MEVLLSQVLLFWSKSSANKWETLAGNECDGESINLPSKVNKQNKECLLTTGNQDHSMCFRSLLYDVATKEDEHFSQGRRFEYWTDLR